MEFDYSWISKNKRWEIDIKDYKDYLIGSVWNNSLNNTKYSKQVSFKGNKFGCEFDGSLPKYLKNEINEYVKNKYV